MTGSALGAVRCVMANFTRGELEGGVPRLHLAEHFLDDILDDIWMQFRFQDESKESLLKPTIKPFKKIWKLKAFES